MPLLSARQLKDWRTYHNKYGLPNRRNDYFFSHIAALANNQISCWTKIAVAQPIDFCPYGKEPITQADIDIAIRHSVAEAKAKAAAKP